MLLLLLGGCTTSHPWARGQSELAPQANGVTEARADRVAALRADRDKEKSAACASVDQALKEVRSLLASGRLLRTYDVLDGALDACPQRVHQIAPYLLPIATALARPRMRELANDVIVKIGTDWPQVSEPAQVVLEEYAIDEKTRQLAWDVHSLAPNDGVPFKLRLRAIGIDVSGLKPFGNGCHHL